MVQRRQHQHNHTHHGDKGGWGIAGRREGRREGEREETGTGICKAVS